MSRALTLSYALATYYSPSRSLTTLSFAHFPSFLAGSTHPRSSSFPFPLFYLFPLSSSYLPFPSFFSFSPKKLNPLSLPPPPLITGTCFFIHKSAFLFFWVGGQSFFAPFPLLFFYSVTETLPQLLLLSSFPGGTTAHTITGRLFLPVALCPPSLARKPPPPLVLCLFFSFYFLFWFLSIPPSS